jgi:hypothetical protein
MKRTVGRPIEKENRTKVGFSLDGKYCDMLNALSKGQGKTKSRIIEEAIAYLYDKEHILSEPISIIKEEEKREPLSPSFSHNAVTVSEVPTQEIVEVTTKNKEILQFDTEQMIKESLTKIQNKEKESNNGKIKKSEEEMRDLARKNAFESLRSIFK